ncbi:MAG: DUF6362 family protein [Acidobacteriaceae bacterium]
MQYASDSAQSVSRETYASDSVQSVSRETSASSVFNNDLVTELERAGATLVALPEGRMRPSGVRSAWPDIVHSAIEAYGWQAGRYRFPCPSAHDISEMDRIFRVVNRLPADRRTWRRIVLLRCLVDPISGRHYWSWRKIGRALGWSGEYARGQWQLAISALALIAGASVPGSPGKRFDAVDKNGHNFQ